MTQAVPVPAPARPLLVRHRTPGLDVTSLHAAPYREWHLTLRPLPGESLAATACRLAAALRQTGAAVVRHEVFGPLAARVETLRSLQQELGVMDWPVMWGGGGVGAAGALAGMHVFAVAGVAVQTLHFSGRPIGRVFHDGQARHCLLGNVQSADLSAPKITQAQATFENLEKALSEVDMNLSHVVRTSFFLDDILSWYGPFNTVRTDFFRQRRIFSGLVPASTGVGGRNPAGAAVVAGAWAVQAADGSASAREVASPLQCPAPDYGSSFSRAVQLAAPGGRRLLLSGTASIAPNGHSAHSGDPGRQVALSLEVVEAILASRGLDFADVTRMTAYFKRLEDAPVFEAWLARRGLDSLPWLATQADICRDELLFELELDAVRSSAEPQQNRLASEEGAFAGRSDSAST